MTTTLSLPLRPKLGISACLLGDPVRYNCGHKESRLCSRDLARHFDFIPVCPEVAIGLGTPRETIRLIGDPGSPRAVGSVTRELDVTEALAEFGERMASDLNGINGYIFMHRSPSCGLERVKVYRENGHTAEGGTRGIYASSFCARHPTLPVEEDGRLLDPVLRENFLARVYAHAQWQALCASGLTRRTILEFHSRYKYQVLANDPLQYKALGRLLAGIGQHKPEEVGPRYFVGLMAALKKCASRRTHSNVLQHLCGYLKRYLSPQEKAEVQRLIDQYRTGIIPLVVPITLLKHHFSIHPNEYIAQQAYLQPHPEELSLRNAI